MIRKAVLAIAVLGLSALAVGSFGKDLQGGGERLEHPPAEKPEEPEAEKPAEQPPPKSLVRGRVVDREGEPPPQARVRFSGPASGSAAAGPDGTFGFEGPAGEYTVTIEIGGRSQSFDVDVSARGLEPEELVFTQDGR